MNYKDYIIQMTDVIPNDKKVKKESITAPKVNNIIKDIEDNISEEFNLSERVVYDRYANKPELSPRMVEMVKRQVRGMNGYTLSRVYETKGTYRMVFESDSDGCFEVTIKEK